MAQYLYSIGLSAFALAVLLSFLWAVSLGIRTRHRGKSWKRLLAWLLLTPHLAFILCLYEFVSCGMKFGLHEIMDSSCQRGEFAAGILMVFFLPFPALAGTVTAMNIFRSSVTAPSVTAPPVTESTAPPKQ